MLNLPDCVKTPEYLKTSPGYPHGVDLRKHRNWRTYRKKVFGLSLAGAGVSKVYVQIEGAPSDVVHFRFVIAKDNNETITVRDLFIALTYYIYLEVEDTQNTVGMTIQDQVAVAYTNEQAKSFFNISNIPYWDPEPGPENFLDAISAVDVSNAFKKEYRLPPSWRSSGLQKKGRRLFRAVLDNKCIFGGLRPSPLRNDTLLLRLLRPGEDPKLYYNPDEDNDDDLLKCIRDM